MYTHPPGCHSEITFRRSSQIVQTEGEFSFPTSHRLATIPYRPPVARRRCNCGRGGRSRGQPDAVLAVPEPEAGVRSSLGWEYFGASCAQADLAAERQWRHLDTMQFQTVLRAVRATGRQRSLVTFIDGVVGAGRRPMGMPPWFRPALRPGILGCSLGGPLEKGAVLALAGPLDFSQPSFQNPDAFHQDQALRTRLRHASRLAKQRRVSCASFRGFLKGKDR
jgi:hypothetical protein